MRALITGGTGFIGRHLVKRLREVGYLCRCLVRNRKKGDELKTWGVEIIYGDVREKASLHGIAQDIDVVYHLAAIGHISAVSRAAYQKFREVNVEGTRNLAEECAQYKIKKFVHFSSTAAIGITEVPLIDETTECKPVTPYQCSKWESELVVLSLWRNRRLPVVILRPSMVYGPGGKGEFLKLCRLMVRGLFPRVGRGMNLMPMVYVDDVVQAALLAGEKGVPGEVYLITSARSFSMDEIRQMVLKCLGIKRPYPYLPYPLAMLSAYAIEILYSLFGCTPIVTHYNIASIVRNRILSIEKAKRELGYEPRISLEEGVRRTLEWYKVKGLL
jgi:nucleoside-diphosphate-sugar epimerase